MTDREATASGGRSLLKVALSNLVFLLGIFLVVRAKEHVEPLTQITAKARLVVGSRSPSQPTTPPALLAAEKAPAAQPAATFTQQLHSLIASSDGTLRAQKLLAGLISVDPERAKREAVIRDGLQESLHEAPGVCPKLNLTVQMPLGGPAESNPMCRAFLGKQRIAIVGNGPLPAAQRGEIETADIVVRFNLMNNWKRLQERLDVWISRFSPVAQLSYWGFTYMSRHEAQAALDISQAVFLLGGRQKHADSVVQRWPSLVKERPIALLLPEEPIFLAFGKDLGLEDAVPSSGYIAVRIAQHCMGQDAAINLYGYNWSPENWAGHDMEAEKRALQAMEAAGQIIIHATACESMRECGTVNFDNSCHWLSDHRYKCLMGSKWVDMTARLPAERRHGVSMPDVPLAKASIAQLANAEQKNVVLLVKPAAEDIRTVTPAARDHTLIKSSAEVAHDLAVQRPPDATRIAESVSSDAPIPSGMSGSQAQPQHEPSIWKGTGGSHVMEGLDGNVSESEASHSGHRTSIGQIANAIKWG